MNEPAALAETVVEKKSFRVLTAMLIYALVALVFLMLSSRVVLKVEIYSLALVAGVGGFFAFVLPAILPQLKRTWLAWLFNAVMLPVFAFVFALLFALAPARMLHLLLPKDDALVTYTVSGRTRASTQPGKNCLYVKAFTGVFNDRVCGYSKRLLEVVRKGDAATFQVRTSLVGYSVVRLHSVTRGERVLYEPEDVR